MRKFICLLLMILTLSTSWAASKIIPKAEVKWIGSTPNIDTPNSFGVPFDKGAVRPGTKFSVTTPTGQELPHDSRVLAYWPDGSVKWGGFSAVIPAGTDSISIVPLLVQKKKKEKSAVQPAGYVTETTSQFVVNTGDMVVYVPRGGNNLVDSIVRGNLKNCGSIRLVASTTNVASAENSVITSVKRDFVSRLDSVIVEQSGNVRTVIKLMGRHSSSGRSWLPFTVRLYFAKGNDQIKMVHTIIYDGDQNVDMISGLGVQLDVPLNEQPYNRYVAFATADGGVWCEPVQPLVGRRLLAMPGDRKTNPQVEQMNGVRLPSAAHFDDLGQELLRDWAKWDDFRLSQLNADSYTIRKRATDQSPWIGTFSGHRASGVGYVGDSESGIMLSVADFWESYPSTLEINNARGDMAHFTAWLWSPEAEPMDLRHYDDVAHGLNASYEDVQDGLSTPYGVARTSEITFTPYIYKGKAAFADEAKVLASNPQLICTPKYLHARRAFGVWSLPSKETPFKEMIESRLDETLDYYKNAVEDHKWYGFWNYGDFMHAYDPVRHEWRYDVGGFAWDNTELASNMWLWYSFLRSARSDLWRLAKAMSRHTGEVDVYHIGDNAGLGSRHNVSHWGCGAKEARISQAAWNRFLYYLTADERSGDLMTEVKDADQKLYTLDPMRLAQPRSKYPCTAPARLRVGPDWVAYAGNWMTQWERTGDTKYRDKILAGMKSIATLPNGIFTGPTVLGFDPATGVVSYEGDHEMINTNHLLSIMGGFELLNELNEMLPDKDWLNAWGEYAANFHRLSREVTHKKFPIPRLAAYGAVWSNSDDLKKEAWDYMLRGTAEMKVKPQMVIIRTPEVPAERVEIPTMSTNGAATWGLDAIYLLEVIPQ
ncbi:MAG: hypothetical protein NC221_01970 [Duncaniella sp.]|nr:hypothetical protein [Muribaculum sp.]MCM1254866.1 hypothetical protein [Duncaniella sp.]